MKYTFLLQKRRPLTRIEAWGCFTANLAMPGMGSLMAGRSIGYAQLTLAAIAFAALATSGLNFFVWYLKNWKQLNAYDPVEELTTLLRAMTWPGISFGLVLFALLWALVTSLQILHDTPKNQPPKSG